ncbi:M23 family metallopeptidase [Jannaschia sp. R86511]|uniref:M23 family metallopeptidase n=1 Tax=Jannaschia sp. R86511 TaxID=3093853 RepID=UPI0036D304BA
MTAGALAVTGLLVVSPATAAESDPLLQMPFPCGEVWNGATRPQHPSSTTSYYALDFNKGSGSDDRGEEVVASAAGTVTSRGGAYGSVHIDHAGGWSTRYLHMSGLQVQVGQSVRAGQLIGFVDDVGSPGAYHLHYEQRLDGVLQHIAFDGSRVNYIFKYNGPAFVSRNCATDPAIPAVDHLTGVPSYGRDAMDLAADLGVWSTSVRGDADTRRYEIAVTLDKLGLLPATTASTSGPWTNGTPGWAEDQMGTAVASYLFSSSVPGDTVVTRADLAVFLDRLGLLGTAAPAPPGEWSQGVPAHAEQAMGRAVRSGAMSGAVPWDDHVQRFEAAIILGHVGVLGKWLEGTPDYAIPTMRSAVYGGLVSPGVAGGDDVTRYTYAVMLGRSGLLDESLEPASSGTWSSGVPEWARASMGIAVAQGLFSPNARGDATVERADFAVVADRLGLLGDGAPAPNGAWSTGIPSWARPAVGKAVARGVLSPNVSWSDEVQRYEAAVFFSHLGLME